MNAIITTAKKVNTTHDSKKRVPRIPLYTTQGHRTVPKNTPLHSSINNDTTLLYYFNDLRNLSLLTKEQEIELGKRIEANDEDAVNQLVNANLRFVVKVAKRYLYCGIPLSDLISEGNIGLIQAAQKFDYKKGYSFTTYAIWYIRQAIIKMIIKMNHMITIPKKQQVKLRKLEEKIHGNRSKANLEEALKEVGMKYSQYMQIQALKKRMVALSQLIYGNLSSNKREVSELLYAKYQDGPAERCISDSLCSVLKEMIGQLTSREKMILVLKFGLDGNPTYSLREIADQFDYSRERIRQIKLQALDKLKKLSQQYMLRAYLN